MANVPTASNSVDDSIPTGVNAALVKVLRDLTVMQPLCVFDPMVQGEGAAKVYPRVSSTLATTTITTGATEADAVDAQEFTTDNVTITATMKALFVTLSKMAAFTSKANLEQEIGTEIGRAVQTAIDTSLAALLGGFSTSYGVTTLDLTADEFMRAVVAYNSAAKEAAGRKVFVGHHKHFEAVTRQAISGVGFGGAGFVQLPGVMEMFAGSGAGMGYQGNFLGVPWILSGNAPTANVGADRAGAIITMPSGPSNVDGALILRMGMPQYQSVPAIGTRQVADIHSGFVPYGVGELNDSLGVTVLTDA